MKSYRAKAKANPLRLTWLEVETGVRIHLCIKLSADAHTAWACPKLWHAHSQVKVGAALPSSVHIHQKYKGQVMTSCSEVVA